MTRFITTLFALSLTTAALAQDQDAVEPASDPGADSAASTEEPAARLHRGARDVGTHELSHRAPERRVASGHLERHASQCVEVGPRASDTP